MLGSITSLGERSRGRHWAVTYAWFVIGALAGGAVLAAALVAVRALRRPLRTCSMARASASCTASSAPSIVPENRATARTSRT